MHVNDQLESDGSYRFMIMTLHQNVQSYEEKNHQVVNITEIIKDKQSLQFKSLETIDVSEQSMIYFSLKVH